MRFISGLLAGILLTVGTAFVVDAMHGSIDGDKASPRMVNWTVVSDNIHGLSADLQDGWARLVGQAKELDKKAGA